MTTDAEPVPIRGRQCAECEAWFLFRSEAVPEQCDECRQAAGRQVGLDGWSDE